MGNIIINTMKVLISLCVAVPQSPLLQDISSSPSRTWTCPASWAPPSPSTECPASPDKPGRSWTRNKTTTSPPPTVRTETAKPVVARPMAPHTAPPPTLVPTMLTTEHTLEDTELLDGTLTTPSCSDLDTKCHHQLHHQCHHLQG